MVSILGMHVRGYEVSGQRQRADSSIEATPTQTKAHMRSTKSPLLGILDSLCPCLVSYNEFMLFVID